MPTYVYRCRDCLEDIEVIQRFSDDPLTICPHCGGALKRLLFPPAIVFKGSGWYSTDYRSPSGNGPTSKTEEKVESEKQPGNGDGRGSEKAAKANSASGKEAS